jgi:hypothetical protein
LAKICKLIDEGVDLVRGPGFTEEDRIHYSQKMGKVLGSEILDVLLEIYVEHPELIPPGFLLPWEDPGEWARKRRK